MGDTTTTLASPPDSPDLGHRDDHAHADDPHDSPWAPVLALVACERQDLWAVLIYAGAVGLLSLVMPVAAQALVNTVAFGGLAQPILVVAFVVFGALGVATALRLIQTYAVEVISRRLFVRTALHLAERLPRVRLERLLDHGGPDAAHKFLDIAIIQKTTASLLLEGVGIVLTTAIGLVVLAFYDPILLAFDALLVGGLALVIAVLGRGAAGASTAESHAKHEVARGLETLLRSPTAFHGPAGRAHARRRLTALTEHWLEARRRRFRIVFRQTSAFQILHALSLAVLLGMGGALVLEGRLSLGQLVAAELILAVVGSGLVKLGKLFENLYDLHASAGKIAHLDHLPLEESGGAPGPASGPRGLLLRLRGVEAGPDGAHALLDGVDLDVRPGERIAVVAAGGAGKSVLASVITGLSRPTRGEITLDGADLRAISVDALRQAVALVRRADAFDGSILENVSMGRPEVGPADVRRALEMAALADVVARLPDGIATAVHEGGSPLSTGEALRLAVARGIAARPRLLVLDGTLDAFDPRARERLLEGLSQEDAGFSLLVLTSHVHGLESFDRVLRLEGGKLQPLPAGAAIAPPSAGGRP